MKPGRFAGYEDCATDIHEGVTFPHPNTATSSVLFLEIRPQFMRRVIVLRLGTHFRFRKT
jgi:hypothetical protein